MAERGTYISLTAMKRALKVTNTTDDVRLLELIENASRQIDSDTGRKFYSVSEARYYSAQWPHVVMVDDLLSISALATDDNGDRTYPTSWLATDYELEPSNSWPKWQIHITPNGTHSFPYIRRGVRITGVWGFGDGLGALPWLASAITVAVATAAGTTLTVAGGTLEAGQTILVGTEQIYMLTATTCERGVNGTTAVAHAVATAISIARYPSLIVDATRMRAEMDYRIPISGVAGGADIGTVSASGRDFARYRDIVESFRLVAVA